MFSSDTAHLSPQHMLEIVYARDSQYNGQFLFGVTSTGIYCLPSCKARKPKAENVVFFDSPQHAEGAGLRACLKCQPNAFYLGKFPEEAQMEALQQHLFNHPLELGDVGSLAAYLGVSLGKLAELCRSHFQLTPLEWLTRSRLHLTYLTLLQTEDSVLDTAFAAGFESLSSFNDNFRRYSLLSPTEYRQMPHHQGFTLELPPQYPLAFVLNYLARDHHNLTERVVGQTYQAVQHLGEQIVTLTLVFSPQTVRLEVKSPDPLEVLDWLELHRRVLFLTGLNLDSAKFEAKLHGSSAGQALLGQRQGYCFPILATPYDALLRAIVGQQVTTTFAATLRRRVVERLSPALEGGLHAPVTPAQVAALTVADLLELGFTTARAQYLIHASSLVASGALPLDTFWNRSAKRLERELLAVRGIGAWTAHYLMMHGYGLADCVPVGDTGLGEGLKILFNQPTRPNPAQTLEQMEAFAPYRTLATFHLWQFFKEI